MSQPEHDRWTPGQLAALLIGAPIALAIGATAGHILKAWLGI